MVFHPPIFPKIIAPNGQNLVPPEIDENLQTWRFA